MNMRIDAEICTPEEDEEWVLKDRQLNAPKFQVVDKEWSGSQDGLPPVGADVEFKHHNFGWSECDVFAHYNGYAICASCGGFYAGSPDQYRLRLSEDNAVKAMMASVDEFIEPEHDFRLLYRAIKAGRIPGVLLGGGHE